MSSSDSEDEIPLSKRVPVASTAAKASTEAAGKGPAGTDSKIALAANGTAPPARGPGPKKPNPSAASGLSQGVQPAKNNIVPHAGFSRDKLSKLGPSNSAPEGAKAPKPSVPQPTASAANANKPENVTKPQKQSVTGNAGTKGPDSKKPAASEPSSSKAGASTVPKPGGNAVKASEPHKDRPTSAAQPSRDKPKAKAENRAQPQNTQEAGPSRPADPAPKPAANPVKPQPVANGTKKRAAISDSDSEDDVPLTKRIAKIATPAKKAVPKKDSEAKAKAKPKASKQTKAEGSGKRKKEAAEKERPAKRQRSESRARDEGRDVKWTKLSHSGVLFPPEYQAHGVKMTYDGRPVDLTAEQEEVASMYAVMLETDYLKKEKFRENFWKAFQGILGRGHAIKSLEKCDFRPIYEHLMAEKETKKAMPKEQKVALKEEKDKAEAKYKIALVDGRKEGVGNFRVEPPGLFRGRGEHPKMGQLKRRIYPRDITINIGEGEEIPEHPYPGQEWKEIRHDNTVTWLAFWKDPISTKDFKYVWLAANSVFKSDSDLAKYEKARKLKNCVDDIRAKYTRDWSSKDLFKQQMGVALYFIDKLALRAGHEKDEDEADTVGCCTLKVENVECMEEPANHIKFDFLGKDSIRYENEVEVAPQVWKLVKQFCSKTSTGAAKPQDAQVFEKLNAQDLNTALKELMDGLSVKVFRTYNASITLDSLLFKDSTSQTVEEKKADYDRANKEVAILCNHQRSVPKGHTDQMQRLADKLQTAQEELDDLTLQLKISQGKGKPTDAKKLKSPEKKIAPEETIKGRIAKKKEQLSRLQVQTRSKEDLKTVALGTSKINYLDPRITVAWCKRQEVPIEKIFNKSLITKFHWAMDIEPDFRF